MQKLTLALVLATGMAATGSAFAQDATPAPAAGASASTTSACGAGPASSSDAAVTATSGTGGDTHNLKVFSCNGVRVGTVLSTTTGPAGTILTISPDANFLNGVTTFQVSAKGATLGDGQIQLAMTDNALRASLAASPGNPVSTQ